MSAINIVALLAIVAATTAIAGAAEPAYPNHPIRLLVGFAPGGGNDSLARLIAPKLTDSMGHNWVIDNRPGAAGNLSTEIVVRANPDGHTVLMALDSQLTANPSLYKLPFSTEKDLQPVVMLATVDQMLVVHPGVQATTVKDLVALARQKPGALNYASSGIGSVNHLIVELLKKRTGIEMVHVPYKGGGAAVPAMLAGESQVLVASVASTMPYVTTRRLRALAATGSKRSRALPDVPTVGESGYPGFDIVAWYPLLVPIATPASIAGRIRSETLKALQHPDVQAGMTRLGMNPETGTPAELVARIRTETAMWAGVIRDAGIRAE